MRGADDPVLYLNDPPGISRQKKRGMLDDVAAGALAAALMLVLLFALGGGRVAA